MYFKRAFLHHQTTRPNLKIPMRSSILVLLLLAWTVRWAWTPADVPHRKMMKMDGSNYSTAENLDNWIQRNGEAPYHIDGDDDCGYYDYEHTQQLFVHKRKLQRFHPGV